MERADLDGGHRFALRLERAGDALAQLVRRAPRKREHEDALRLHAVVEELEVAADEQVRLPGSWSGGDVGVAAPVRQGGFLFGS